MRKNRLMFLPAVAIFFLFLVSAIGLAFAVNLKDYGGSLNALGSGYAITRWPPGGGDILPGQPATVRAYTTEYPTAIQVVFRWHSPDGSSFDTDPEPLVLSPDTWDSLTVHVAENTQTLDMIGDWGVQALFLNEEGKLQGPNPYPIVKIKAISWHVIPEVPLGTIAAIISMFGALSVLAVRAKTNWRLV